MPQEVELLHLAYSNHHLGLRRRSLHQSLAVGSVAVVYFVRVRLADFLGVNDGLLDLFFLIENLADVLIFIFFLAVVKHFLASLDAVLDE
jgi:hypothetical protein